MRVEIPQNAFAKLQLVLAAAGLIAGTATWFYGELDLARWVWFAGTLPVLLSLITEIVRSLARGDVGLDVVAALSMSAAMLFGEHLAANVVALMYAGGTFLERFAEGRARYELRALLGKVPRSATRYGRAGLEDVDLDAIRPGDRLLIRQGDVVPVDGALLGMRAVLDQSALTGEAMPVVLKTGDPVMSGATNVGDAFDLAVEALAADSTYAGIVRLVETAQKSKAPMSRLADRYALLFLLLTVGIAGAAWWFTGDPIRAVAVLVVATPCPLILAVPVALTAGLSRAAKYGVLTKGAKALEALAQMKTLILDKTGTLTDGRPQIVRIEPSVAFGEAEVLCLAAELDQASKHPIAQALVAAAKARGMVLALPDDMHETPGEGVAGRIAGRSVVVGGDGFVMAQVSHDAIAMPDRDAGSVVVSLGVDGRLAGRITLADVLRPGMAEFLAGLRRQGVGRIVLATGDRKAVAMMVTRDLGLDALWSDLTPDQKVMLVLSERKHGPVMMVGDGVNDAPALAAADLGVAMGARGAAASAEAADVVLLIDRLDPLLAGVEIARRSRRIAVQSVVAGIGMSCAGMVAAAFGHLTPIEGAVLQELIDLAVVLNALRTLRIVPREGQHAAASA
jgi:heavy metal translocating P-type ATPase